MDEGPHKQNYILMQKLPPGMYQFQVKNFKYGRDIPANDSLMVYQGVYNLLEILEDGKCTFILPHENDP